MRYSFKFNIGIFILVTILTAVSFSSNVNAAYFNRHKIISDDDMTDYSRMTASAIQSFLDSKGGILAGYSTADIDGTTRTAAEIIYRTSSRYRLNPQFIISHIQKESSLITGSNSNLIDWVLGYGVCDGCSKDNPKVIKYKGFAKQLDAAGNQIRNSYISDLELYNSTVSGWGINKSKQTLDGITIVPQNMATAVLYTYTPWLGYHGGDSSVGGNSLFFDIMERFFPNRTSKILDYPESTLFQDVSTGSVYKLENGKIRPIISLSALLSNYDPNRIVPVESTTLDRYSEGDPISMPKFLLLQDPAGGIYLIDQNHNRRAITSKEVFRSLGYNPEEVIPVSYAELASIPESPPLTNADKYPLGGLIQNQNTGAVYYLDKQKDLHAVIDKSILDNKFKGYSISAESNETIKEFNETDPVKLSDGTLVKIPYRDVVYVIDNGKKRPVKSDTVLNQLGGYGSVTEVTKDVLKMHPIGNEMKMKKSNKKTVTKKKKNKK